MTPPEGGPMGPLPDEDLTALGERQLRALVGELERRQPPATIRSAGVRPDRRPWTYRDIWRLRAMREELARRGLGER